MDERGRPRLARFTSVVAIAPALLAFVVTLATTSGASDTVAPRTVVQRTGGAVVVLEASDDTRRWQGSGFLVEPAGTVVTNLHVVDGANRLSITFRDGTRNDDPLVRAFDVDRDLAVLEVDPRRAPDPWSAVVLGDASQLVSGDPILVIGNPMGLEQTVTQGIVSAWREPSPDDDRGRVPEAWSPRTRLMQISADITSGSSGGPVLDERGEVVGVATSGFRGAAGLNFAVPVDVLPDMIAETDSMDLATLRERVDDVRFERARPDYERARLAFDRGEMREADARIERALAIHPRHAAALLLAGRIALATDRPDLARERIDRSVELDQDDAEAWFLAGLVRQRQSDGDAAMVAEAEDRYDLALDLDPRHAGAAYHLAMIEAGRGLLDRAEELLQVAIDSEPRFADAHYAMGEIHVARERWEDAKDEFQQVLWEDDEHALAHYGLAKVHTMTDQGPFGGFAYDGPAARHWARFLELSDGVPELATQREVALRVVAKFFPELLQR